MSSLFTGVRWGGRGSDGRPPDNGTNDAPPSNPWAHVTGPLTGTQPSTQPWMGDDWIDPGTNWWNRMPSLPYAEPEPEPEPEPEEEVLGGTGAEEVRPPLGGDGPHDPGRDFHGSSRSYDSFGDWMDAAFGDMENSDWGNMTSDIGDAFSGIGDSFRGTAVGDAFSGLRSDMSDINASMSQVAGFNVGAAMTGFSIGNAVMPGIGGIVGAFAGAALADQPPGAYSYGLDDDPGFDVDYPDGSLDGLGGGGGDGYGGPGGSAVGTGRGWDRPDPGSGYSPSPGGGGGGDGPDGGGGGGSDQGGSSNDQGNAPDGRY